MNINNKLKEYIEKNILPEKDMLLKKCILKMKNIKDF